MSIILYSKTVREQKLDEFTRIQELAGVKDTRVTPIYGQYIDKTTTISYTVTMNTFEYQFTVEAPLTAVSGFHHDTSILKKLTPPPIFIQIHHFDPLGENSIADMTMWVGPIPLPWTAVHTNVTEQGFTDTMQSGPLKHWQHTHRFEAIAENKTLVKEHIEYKYPDGLAGLFPRLMFNRAGLFMLFTARKWLTRWHVARQMKADSDTTISTNHKS